MSTEHKTFIGKIIAGVINGIHWLNRPFANLLDEAEKAYESLHEEEQTVLKQASAYIALVTQFENVTPDFVYNAMAEKFPGFTKQQMVQFTNGLAMKLQTGNSLLGANIPTTLTNIATYLNAHQGKDWVIAIQSAVGFLSSLLTSEGTVIQKILLCVEYVYRHYIVKELETVKQA